MMRPTNDDATKFPKNSVDLMFARTLNVNSFFGRLHWQGMVYVYSPAGRGSG